jgi:hypothetical protein
MIPGVAEGLILLGATTLVGAVAAVGRRVLSKLDGIDLVVRGDGNGNPGLARRLDLVHAEVKETRADLADHAAGESERVELAMRRFKEEQCEGVEECA